MPRLKLRVDRVDGEANGQWWNRKAVGYDASPQPAVDQLIAGTYVWAYVR